MASEEDPTGQLRPAAVDLGIEGYEDAAVIGRGGFALVYRARQRSFNRTVAVKVLSGAVLDDAALRRFDRERAAIGALSGHPNIVTVYDSGFTKRGVPYLAMEHLAKGSLADRLYHDGLLDWRTAITFGVKLAGGLESAHRLGVLHRDIKPENVLLSNFGDPKIADFGIAHVVGGPETRTAHLELSVLHAPPEVVDGNAATEASDVYSLASTLFTLLWGAPPFLDEGDESLVGLLVRIGTAPLPNLTAMGAPASLQRVFEKAMAKERADRYPSALAFGRALQGEQERLGLPVTPLPLAGEADADDAPPPAGPATERLAPTVAVDAPAAPAVAEPHVRGRRLSRLVIGLGLVVVVLAGLVVALHERPSSRPSITGASQPTPTGVPSPAAQALQTAKGTIPAGLYTTTLFKPQLTLKLDDGWALQSPETSRALELGRADAPNSSLNFYVVDEVIDPAAAPAKPSAVGPAAGPTDAKKAVPFLEGNRRLTVWVTAPIGGRHPGTVVSFSVVDPYRYDSGAADNECAVTACVLLFRDAASKKIIAAYQGDLNKFYVFNVNGVFVLATVTGPSNEQQRFVPKATPLVGAAL